MFKKNTFKSYVAWFSFLFFLGNSSLLPPTVLKKTADQPNILIIFSDDHALNAISAYGSPYIQTP